jgi:MFS family permease
MRIIPGLGSSLTTPRGAWVGMLLVSSGAMALFPLLPALQNSLDIPTSAIGAIAAAGFAGALIAELGLASYADRGRARLMGVLGVALVAASLVGSAFATQAWHLAIGRGIGGVGVGMFTAAATALLVRSDPARSGELLGRLSAAELLGVALGPMAAALLLEVAAPGPILAGVGVVVLVAVPVVLATFVEHRPQAGVLKHQPPRVAFDLLVSGRVAGIVLLFSAIWLTTGAYDGIWPRFMDDIGAEPALTAASYAVFALPYVLVAGAAGRFADRRGGVRAFVLGAAIQIPIVALYGIIVDPWVATGVALLESSGQAFAIIGAAAALAHTVDPARAGGSQGLMRAAGLIAATVAAAASGAVYQWGGPIVLFVGTAAAVVLVAAIGLACIRSSSRLSESNRRPTHYECVALAD